MSAWYRNGTIAVAGKTVTGTGTNFTDNKNGIGPGQALLIPGAGTVKVYEISRVDSATQLTLNDDAGTVAAGQAYAIMSFYSDSVPDFARRLSAQLSYYQAQMDGWQEIMTGTGSITLEAPDGTQVTVSSFKKLTTDMAAKADKTALDGKADKTALDGKADKINGVVPVTQGGTGGATAAAARTSLNAVGVGDYGLGGSAVAFNGSAGCGFAQISSFPPTTDVGTSCVHVRTGGYAFQIAAALAGTPRMWVRNMLNSSSDLGWRECYTTGNTTKASDGTLKAASPVARIVKSRESSTRIDIAEEGFSWCGCGTCNDEAEGISLSRLGTGEYKLTGAAGFAKEGWRLLPPRDPNGSGDLGIVEAEETDSGGITVRLYKRKYKLTDDGDIELVKGALIDVPENSWIDVRLDMPADSIWNQKMAASQKEAEEVPEEIETDQQATPDN